MKANLWRMIVAAIAVGISAQAGSAEEIIFSEYENLSSRLDRHSREVAELKASNTQLQARLDSLASGGKAGCADVAACDDGCGRISLYGGGAVLFLRPSFHDNVAYTLNAPNGVRTAQPFGYEYETAWRAWLGLEGQGGLGIRGTYFQFDHSSARAQVAPAGGGTSAVLDPESQFLSLAFNMGDAVAASHSLEIHVVDMEATQSVNFGSWELMGSFGARYASFKQDYNFAVNGGALGILGSRYKFEGAGPTAALEVRRPVYPRLSIFSTARGSIIWGESDWRGGDPTLANNFLLIYDADGALAIGELQAGVKWNVGNWFAQGAVEAQAWHGTQSITRSDELMVLVGSSVAAGFEY